MFNYMSMCDVGDSLNVQLHVVYNLIEVISNEPN
jgi:hypothetical protein